MNIKQRITKLESTLVPVKPITFVICDDGETKEQALIREGVNEDGFSIVFCITFD